MKKRDLSFSLQLRTLDPEPERNAPRLSPAGEENEAADVLLAEPAESNPNLERARDGDLRRHADDAGSPRDADAPRASAAAGIGKGQRACERRARPPEPERDRGGLREQQRLVGARKVDAPAA